MVLGGTRFIGAAIMNWPRQTNARIAPGLPPASRGGERARARLPLVEVGRVDGVADPERLRQLDLAVLG